jgi:signal transduction histidine kinase
MLDRRCRRELARGIHPAVLAKGGLRFALRTLARRCPIPVDLQVHAKERLPEPVEVSAYYVVAEALTNAARHAHASAVGVEAEIVGDLLRVTVRDDGVGGASLAGGSGLAGLKDRVEALGGRIVLHCPPERVPACARSSPLPPRVTASPPVSPGPETARAALPRGHGRAGARRRRPRCRTRAECGARRCS